MSSSKINKNEDDLETQNLLTNTEEVDSPEEVAGSNYLQTEFSKNNSENDELNTDTLLSPGFSPFVRANSPQSDFLNAGAASLIGMKSPLSPNRSEGFDSDSSNAPLLPQTNRNKFTSFKKHSRFQGSIDGSGGSGSGGVGLQFSPIPKNRSAFRLNTGFYSPSQNQVGSSSMMEAYGSQTSSPTQLQTPTNFLDTNENLADTDWNDGMNIWDNDNEFSLGRKVAYDDFTTIDWTHDFNLEELRKRKLNKGKGIRKHWNQLVDKSKGWIVVLSVGASVGILAGYINVVSEWLSDLKIGYCSTNFYLNQEFCCWGNDPPLNLHCPEWVPWGQILSTSSSSTSPALEYILGYSFYILFSLILALVSAILVLNFAPYAAGCGITEVKTILGGFVIRRFLGKWTLLIKSVGLCLSSSSGLSIGKEGPLVHVACCCGNLFLRFFNKYKHNEAKKREILSAAASAGVSVAFGAPIGGVLFSLEELSYYFPLKTMWRSFISAMVASIFLKIVNPFRTGKLVMFQVTYTRNWHGFEMIFFLILGVLGGLYGTLFIKLNLWLTKFRRDSWLNKYPIQEVIAITLITSAIGFPNIFMRLDTSELLSNLFTECDDNSLSILCPKSNIFKTITLLLIASLLKLLLTIVTFGVRVPAGLFLPSMAIGACVGRVVGIIVQELSKNSQSFFFQTCQVGTNCINPGTYAMVGAAAALGGVTRMTVSLVVVMFELTGALTYVLPIMVAVMTSKWVGDAFDRGGIYDGLIRLNGYPFLHNKQDYPSDHTTGQVMTRVNDLVVIPADQISLSQIDELLQYTNFKGFPIVRSSNDPFLIGFISRSELRTGIEHAKLSSTVDGSSPCLFDIVDSDSLGILEHGSFVDLRYWTDHTPITVTPTTTMGVVIDLFCKLGLRYVLVAKHGELLGVITKKDVLKHIDIIEYPKLAQGNNIA